MGDLRFESVEIAYGRNSEPAVFEASFTASAGQTLGLVGESGSGKSSLARAAAGLVKLNRGHIALDGHVIADATTRRRRRPPRVVQMIYQDPAAALNPRRTAGQSILEGVAAAGVDRGAFAAELDRVLDLVHLHRRHADRLPGELSGGQRQRVAVARALAARPEVIVADEITSALDVSVQSAVLNLLRELQQEAALTVVFISHNLAAVRYVSDHIIVMRQGRIVDSGPSATLLSASRVQYTRELVEAVLEVPAPHG